MFVKKQKSGIELVGMPHGYSMLHFIEENFEI